MDDGNINATAAECQRGINTDKAAAENNRLFDTLPGNILVNGNRIAQSLKTEHTGSVQPLGMRIPAPGAGCIKQPIISLTFPCRSSYYAPFGINFSDRITKQRGDSKL